MLENPWLSKSKREENGVWGLPQEKIEIAPFESLDNTLRSLLKNEYIINPMLTSSRNAVA